jgi:hypothetical protein
MKIIGLVDDPAVICRILTHRGLWRERKGNERGTAPLEGPESDADFVYESATAGRVTTSPGTNTIETRSRWDETREGSDSDSGYWSRFLACNPRRSA